MGSLDLRCPSSKIKQQIRHFLPGTSRRLAIGQNGCFLFVFIFVYVVESVFVFVFLSWCQGGGPSGTEFRDRRLLAPPTSPTLTLQSHCTAHTGCPKKCTSRTKS